MKIGSNDIGMARNSSVTGRSKLKRESILFEKKKKRKEGKNGRGCEENDRRGRNELDTGIAN